MQQNAEGCGSVCDDRAILNASIVLTDPASSLVPDHALRADTDSSLHCSRFLNEPDICANYSCVTDCSFLGSGSLVS